MVPAHTAVVKLISPSVQADACLLLPPLDYSSSAPSWEHLKARPTAAVLLFVVQKYKNVGAYYEDEQRICLYHYCPY